MSRSHLGLATALLAGVVFGFGLAIARMTDPGKVLDFLDFAAIPSGGWDPSLAFVMGSALLVAFFGLRLDRLMKAPAAAPAFLRSQRTALDRPLLVGAALFGIGWGMAGFCPGPAIADLGIIPDQVYLFVAAMVLSSWITGEAMEWRAGGGAVAMPADAAAE